MAVEARYREENKKLEDVVSELETRNSRKTGALQSLCDHFFNSTCPKLEGVLDKSNSRDETGNNSRNEDLSIIKSLETKPKK